MQAELFNLGTSGRVTETSQRLVEPAALTWLDRLKVTLRLEHMSIAAILALVLYVLVFSFGVEKGKRMALRELEAQKSRQEHAAQALAPTAELDTDIKIPQISHIFINKVGRTSSEPVPITVPPVPVEAPEAVTPSTLGKYTIQAITFTDKARAEEEMKKIAAKGYQAFIIPGKKFFQVCIDRFETVSLAKVKLGALKADGFVPDDAYIRPVPGV